MYETRTLEHQGIQEVMEMLKDKTSAFCGNSGAGKSTLLNAIDPRLSLDTGDISQKLAEADTPPAMWSCLSCRREDL